MASAPNASAPGGLDSTPRDFAIVIGISRYEHLPALQGPANDALAFATWLGDPQGGRLAESDIQALVTTNSIPLDAEKIASARIHYLSIAPLLSEAIKRIHNNASVSSLFV